MAGKLAVQMYTLRDFTKSAKDFAQSLEKVSAMGYPAVQLSAIGCMNGDEPEVSAAEARSMLDDNGLKCIATHRSWDALASATEEEIDFHKTLGCDYVAIGSLPGEYRDQGEDGFRKFLVDFRPVAEKLKENGLMFGYHNHSHEFIRTGNGRQTLYDIFIDEGGDLFNMEVDVYWVAHAGANPQRIIERCRGRVSVIHFKDKEVVADGPIMAAIGEGNLDWDNLIPACETAGVEWYAIEQDTCPRDPFDCLKSSYDFLTAMGL